MDTGADGDVHNSEALPGDIAIIGDAIALDGTAADDELPRVADVAEVELDAEALRRKKLLEAIARIRLKIQEAHSRRIDIPDAVAKMYVELVEKLQRQLDSGSEQFDRELYDADLIDIRLDSAIDGAMANVERDVKKHTAAAEVAAEMDRIDRYDQMKYALDDFGRSGAKVRGDGKQKKQLVADEIGDAGRMEHAIDAFEHSLSMMLREAAAREKATRGKSHGFVREITYAAPRNEYAYDGPTHDEPDEEPKEKKEKKERVVYDRAFQPDGDEKQWRFFTMFVRTGDERNIAELWVDFDESVVDHNKEEIEMARLNNVSDWLKDSLAAVETDIKDIKTLTGEEHKKKNEARNHIDSFDAGGANFATYDGLRAKVDAGAATPDEIKDKNVADAGIAEKRGEIVSADAAIAAAAEEMKNAKARKSEIKKKATKITKEQKKQQERVDDEGKEVDRYLEPHFEAVQARYESSWKDIARSTTWKCVEFLRSVISEAGKDAADADGAAHGVFLKSIKKQMQDIIDKTIEDIEGGEGSLGGGMINIDEDNIKQIFSDKIADWLNDVLSEVPPKFNIASTKIDNDKILEVIEEHIAVGIVEARSRRHLFRLGVDGDGKIIETISSPPPKLSEVFMTDGAGMLWSARRNRADGTGFLAVYADSAGNITTERVNKYSDEKYAARVGLSENADIDGVFGAPPLMYVGLKHIASGKSVMRGGEDVILQYEHQITPSPTVPGGSGPRKFTFDAYDTMRYCDILFAAPNGEWLKLNCYGADGRNVMWFSEWNEYGHNDEAIKFASGTDTDYMFIANADKRYYFSCDDDTHVAGVPPMADNSHMARPTILQLSKKGAVQFIVADEKKAPGAFMLGQRGKVLKFEFDANGIPSELTSIHKKAPNPTYFYFYRREIDPAIAGQNISRTDAKTQRFFGSGALATVRDVGGFICGAWHLHLLWAVVIVLAVMVMMLMTTNVAAIARRRRLLMAIGGGGGGGAVYDAADDAFAM